MIKNFFTKNIGMKILSLTIAIFMWVYVALILNPQTEVRIRNIPIAYSNYYELSQKNLMLLDKQQQTLDIQLKGERNLLNNVTNKNITATIDLSQCSSEGQYDLPIQIVLPLSGVTISYQSLTEISVNVDVLENKSVPITLMLNGTPKDGYVVSPTKQPTVNPTRIIIQGPKSELSKIETAEAYVDLDHQFENMTVLLSFQDLAFLSVNKVAADTSKLSSTTTNIEAKVFIEKVETQPDTSAILPSNGAE